METDPTSAGRRPAVSGVEIAHRTDGAVDLRLRATHRTVGAAVWPSPRGNAAWVVLATRPFDRVISRLASHLAPRGVHTLRIESRLEPSGDESRSDLTCALGFLSDRGVSRIAVGAAAHSAVATLNAFLERPDLRICALLSPVGGSRVHGGSASRPVLLACGGNADRTLEIAKSLDFGVAPLVFRGASECLEEVAGDLAAAWVPALSEALL